MSPKEINFGHYTCGCFQLVCFGFKVLLEFWKNSLFFGTHGHISAIARYASASGHAKWSVEDVDMNPFWSFHSRSWKQPFMTSVCSCHAQNSVVIWCGYCGCCGNPRLLWFFFSLYISFHGFQKVFHFQLNFPQAKHWKFFGIISPLGPTGGIAGLSCAVSLLRHFATSGQEVSVALVEWQERLGGRLYSCKVGPQQPLNTEWYIAACGRKKGLFKQQSQSFPSRGPPSRYQSAYGCLLDFNFLLSRCSIPPTLKCKLSRDQVGDVEADAGAAWLHGVDGNPLIEDGWIGLEDWSDGAVDTSQKWSEPIHFGCGHDDFHHENGGPPKAPIFFGHTKRSKSRVEDTAIETTWDAMAIESPGPGAQQRSEHLVARPCWDR